MTWSIKVPYSSLFVTLIPCTKLWKGERPKLGLPAAVVARGGEHTWVLDTNENNLHIHLEQKSMFFLA